MTSHDPIPHILAMGSAIRSEVARRMSRPTKGTTTIMNTHDWREARQAAGEDRERRIIEAATQPRAAAIAVPGVGDIPDIPFDLRPVRMQWGTFLQYHSQGAEAEKFMGEFKRLLRQVAGNATVLNLDQRQVATFRRDGRLNMKKLKAEQPQIIAKYTRMVCEEKFDEAAFRDGDPDVWAAYRGETLRLVDRPLIS